VLGPGLARGALRAVRLPFFAQSDFDRLLWSCDLNFVRGEDSFVRAIWAGAPFVWQAYLQDDGAHAIKLAAFLDRFLAGAPAALAAMVRPIFQRWNGLVDTAAPALALDDVAATDWHAHCLRWRDALAARDDLTTRLCRFVATKR
jgi:uncharacterized repeat protein (TIGR03837 family)